MGFTKQVGSWERMKTSGQVLLLRVRVINTNKRCEGILLVCLSLGHTQERARRGTHSLFVGSLKHQKIRSFKNLQFTAPVELCLKSHLCSTSFPPFWCLPTPLLVSPRSAS